MYNILLYFLLAVLISNVQGAPLFPDDASETRFALGDTNKDGKLTFDEFLYRSSKYYLEDLRKEFKIVDLNKDTFVNLAEYTKYYKRVEKEILEHEEKDNDASPLLQVKVVAILKIEPKPGDKSSADKEANPESRFKQGDRNGDGKLTFGEFVNTSKYLLEWQRNEFKKMDTNKDRFISKKEYGAFFHKIANLFRTVQGKIFADAIKKYRFDPRHAKALYEGDIYKLLADRYHVKPKGTFAKTFKTFDEDGNHKWDVEEFIRFDTNFPWDEMDPVEDPEERQTGAGTGTVSIE